MQALSEQIQVKKKALEELQDNHETSLLRHQALTNNLTNILDRIDSHHEKVPRERVEYREKVLELREESKKQNHLLKMMTEILDEAKRVDRRRVYQENYRKMKTNRLLGYVSSIANTHTNAHTHAGAGTAPMNMQAAVANAVIDAEIKEKEKEKGSIMLSYREINYDYDARER